MPNPKLTVAIGLSLQAIKLFTTHMTNYTGFAEIEIGGKKRPFYYGIAAAEIYCEELGKQQNREVEFHEFQEALTKAFGENFDPIYAGRIFSACLLAGYEYKDMAVDFKPREMKFWIQEFTPETYQEILKVITGANKSPNADAPSQAEQK